MKRIYTKAVYKCGQECPNFRFAESPCYFCAAAEKTFISPEIQADGFPTWCPLKCFPVPESR